jgi:RNA polymerase sigma-70 factor (ECF subfamily)
MVSASRNGSIEALTELVRRWDDRIMAYLTKATGDPDAAKDLRQEVFLRVHRYGKTYDPKYAFSTWLFRIAGNALSTWRSKRGQAGSSNPAVDDVPDPAPNPIDQASRAELDDQVQAAIVRLQPLERALLLQRFYLDMSYREIGEIQGVPETTVKSRTYAILQRLRQSLGQALT